MSARSSGSGLAVYPALKKSSSTGMCCCLLLRRRLRADFSSDSPQHCALRGATWNRPCAREHGRSAGGSRRLHSGFVMAEIALAVVLLVAAGILGRTVLRLSSLDPGVNVHNVLAARVALSPGALQNRRADSRFVAGSTGSRTPRAWRAIGCALRHHPHAGGYKFIALLDQPCDSAAGPDALSISVVRVARLSESHGHSLTPRPILR